MDVGRFVLEAKVGDNLASLDLPHRRDLNATLKSVTKLRPQDSLRLHSQYGKGTRLLRILTLDYSSCLPKLTLDFFPVLTKLAGLQSPGVSALVVRKALQYLVEPIPDMGPHGSVRSERITAAQRPGQNRM